MAPNSTSQSPDGITIRRASAADLPVLGGLGASLLRLHYTFDPLRFMAPSAHLEDGYAWFLGTQLEEQDTAVFVAERSGAVVGYVYVALEPQSWKELREAAGYIHDVVVAPEAQRLGLAAALIETACEWLRSNGAPRVILGTAEKNEQAQRVFERLGFRRTMIEMTKELPPARDAD
jgi:ribosomal protein S18 acetylase RimI-like enzyme